MLRVLRVASTRSHHSTIWISRDWMFQLFHSHFHLPTITEKLWTVGLFISTNTAKTMVLQYYDLCAILTWKCLPRMHHSAEAGFYKLTSPNFIFHFSYTAKLHGDTLCRILLSESWKSWNLMLRILPGSRHRIWSGFSSATTRITLIRANVQTLTTVMNCDFNAMSDF
jgi:hypothetical protein